MERIVIAVVVGVLASCSTTRESEDDSKRGISLRESEASFRPSEFDQPVRDFFPEHQGAAERDTSSATANLPLQPPDLTQGYRVQIFATTTYDDATRMKAAVEAQFADEWFYLVYDAPTYKLRGGNFRERYEADRFARLLSEKGYKDGWVVPEKVHSNPPPRSTLPPEPGK
jgi:hypothetical protein